MSISGAKAGDKVVFYKDKTGPSPGPRATDIAPQEKGDAYSYIVEKYWTVKEVHADGSLTLTTRRGKEHRIASDDPRLRPASLWERLMKSQRFPAIADPT